MAWEEHLKETIPEGVEGGVVIVEIDREKLATRIRFEPKTQESVSKEPKASLERPPKKGSRYPFFED